MEVLLTYSKVNKVSYGTQSLTQEAESSQLLAAKHERSCRRWLPVGTRHRKVLGFRTALKGPEKPITQRSISAWERSTEEDRRQVADLQATFKEADKDGCVE